MSANAQPGKPAVLGKFTCNVCGAANQSSVSIENPENETCAVCRSSIRLRSVILTLSRALFGIDLQLGDFPLLKSVRGLGISDSEVYAGRLEERFHYTNTFYHKEPRFDLTQPDPAEYGKYDFVICSEVLEHVPAPVDRAFETLARLLKPSGALILTSPYSIEGKTVESFANLHETALAEINGRMVLVNRSQEGNYEVFDQLVFHGGDGSTLEMRLFSELDLRALLTAAGLTSVRIDASGSREFGVVYESLCSLPVTACREPFSLSAGAIREMTEPLLAARAIVRACRQSRWVRLGRLFGVGPDLR